MTNEPIQDFILLGTGSSAPTPPAGGVALYRHTDGSMYYKDENVNTGAVGGGGAHPDLATHDTLGLATQAL